MDNFNIKFTGKARNDGKNDIILKLKYTVKLATLTINSKSTSSLIQIYELDAGGSISGTIYKKEIKNVGINVLHMESLEFNKDKSMQNNTNANSKEQNFTSSQGNDSQIKALKFKVNALATILVLTIIGGAYGAYQFDKHKYDDLEIITNALKATEQNVLNTQNKINSVYTDILEKDKRADILFSQNADLRSQNNVLKNNEEALQEKIDAAVVNTDKINIRLNNYEDRNPYDWFIAQSYF